MNRRQFLIGLTTIGAVGALSTLPRFSQQEKWLVSAGSDNNNNFFAAAFNADGQLINKVPLPARGHDSLAMPHKPGHALIFARRPGHYVVEVDFINGRIVKTIAAPNGQHFYGHGIFNHDHSILVTSENDYHQGRGLIVLRDSTSYQVLEQFDSGGIGPHQLALMPDKKQLVIANGGILTHPDQPRAKLNLATMAPNLAYLELATGKVIEKYQLDNKQLSIRHLAVAKTGKVIAGLQYQGAKTDMVPLAIAHQGESQLSFLQATNNQWLSMNQYTASVCIDDVRQHVAITCPKAGMITYWHLATNEFIASEKLRDGAGVTLLTEGFIASTGKGRIVQQSQPLQPYKVRGEFNNIRWDNHLTSIHRT